MGHKVGCGFWKLKFRSLHCHKARTVSLQIRPGKLLLAQLISRLQRPLLPKKTAALKGSYHGIISHWGPSPPQAPPSLGSTFKSPGISQSRVGHPDWSLHVDCGPIITSLTELLCQKWRRTRGRAKGSPHLSKKFKSKSRAIVSAEQHHFSAQKNSCRIH